MHGARVRRAITRWGLFLTLTIGAALVLAPITFMVSASFQPLPEILRIPPALIPRAPSLQNYYQVFQAAPFLQYFYNSLRAALVTVVSVLLTSALAGYAFAKFRFPGRDLLFLLILSQLMIPFQLRMVTLFELVFRWRLIDTFPGLVLPGLVDAFGIFLMRQFIRTIPDELIDAARIDGASELRIFASIILPLLKPALAALAILTFMWNWEAFLWPLVVASSDAVLTLPVGLAKFGEQYLIRYDLQLAAATLITLPVLLAFLATQRYIVQGITLTGFR
jgi:multiple sugar transport system permease protein